MMGNIMLIEFGKYQVYFCKKRNKTLIFSFVLLEKRALYDPNPSFLK